MGVRTHVCNPNSLEAKARGSVVPGHPVLNTHPEAKPNKQPDRQPDRQGGIRLALKCYTLAYCRENEEKGK